LAKVSRAKSEGHPRVGGGTYFARYLEARRMGPSPRGRGNRGTRHADELRSRTIPAWAGEPRADCRAAARPEDHPRVGGGTSGKNLGHLQLCGPSPRGRGNPKLCQDNGWTFRTIPAWAGEPRVASNSIRSATDHPRVGGGTLKGVWTTTQPPGPSPRGRGNLDLRQEVRQAYGTIPAWAGEPRQTDDQTYLRKDHPRVGGGTVLAPAYEPPDPGPSPRGRGNPEPSSPTASRDGTIPAWAGEPRSPRTLHRQREDHPRVGGGTP